MCPMTLQINNFNVVWLFLFEPVETVMIFFPPAFFFHEYSQFTGQQGKGEAIPFPLYDFHSLHEHLDISQEITTGRSPLHIANTSR